MPPKKKAKKTQTVYLDKRAHAKLLRGRASAFELTIQIIFLLHSLNIRRMFYTTAYQGSNSGQILTKHASIAFTINQAEYLNGANVNHWMLTVSQICEKMTKIKYNITSQKKNGTYTYDNKIKLFLHVSKNKQNFFRYRNKEFAIRERLRRSAFVRLTLRALSKLYDFHFHFREMRKVFGNSKRMIQYEVYASMGVGRSYASMNGMTLQIKKICNCPHSVSKEILNHILVYNRKNSRMIEAGVIQHLKTIIDAKSTEKAQPRYKIHNTYVPTKDPCQQFCIVSKPYKAILTPHGAQMATFFAASPITDIFEVIPPQYNTNGFNNYVRLSIPNRWYVVQENKTILCKTDNVEQCYERLSESFLSCSHDKKCQNRARNLASLKLTDDALEHITDILYS